MPLPRTVSRLSQQTHAGGFAHLLHPAEHALAYISTLRSKRQHWSVPRHSQQTNAVSSAHPLHPTEPSLDTSAYVSIRQHTPAYASMRQHASAYFSMRQHTSACVSKRCWQHKSAYMVWRFRGMLPCGTPRARVGLLSVCHHTSAYVSIRQHTAYDSIRQHTSAYVSVGLLSVCHCI